MKHLSEKSRPVKIKILTITCHKILWSSSTLFRKSNYSPSPEESTQRFIGGKL